MKGDKLQIARYTKKDNDVLISVTLRRSWQPIQRVVEMLFKVLIPLLQYTI